MGKTVISEEKTVGRDLSCSYIICGLQNKVSRKHLSVKKEGNSYFVMDLNSSNGTYLNNNRIKPSIYVPCNPSDSLLLGNVFKLNISEVFKAQNLNDSETKILSAYNSQIQIQSGEKTISIDIDKTSVGELLNLDTHPFKSIGRDAGNDIIIKNDVISRRHCKIKLHSPLMFEIWDLKSTNGTFVDGVKLVPDERKVFRSNAEVRLGEKFILDLKIYFPNIEIPKPPKPMPKVNPGPHNNNQPSMANQDELEHFNGLESIWKEYNERNNMLQTLPGKYLLGAAAVTGIATVVLGPLAVPLGLASAATGGSVVGLVGAGSMFVARFLGQQKSNEIKLDNTYEDNFLLLYSCPRCQESFQKKPWITIRECSKCKTKFRNI